MPVSFLKGDKVKGSKGEGVVFWSGYPKNGYRDVKRVGYTVNGDSVFEDACNLYNLSHVEREAKKAAALKAANEAIDFANVSYKLIAQRGYSDHHEAAAKILKPEYSDDDLKKMVDLRFPAGNGYGVLRYSGGVSNIRVDREAGVVRFESITMLVD